MARHQPSVSIDLAHLLLKYATEHDIGPPVTAEAFGVSRDALTNPGARIPAAQFNALWQAIASASGDPDFGLHFGASLRTPPEGSILFSVMMNCRSLGEAMEKLSRYHGLMTDLVQLHLNRKTDAAFYTLKAATPDIALDRHYAEAVLCGQVLTLRYLTENQARVIEARFRHARPGNVEELARVFRCPLLFDQPQNELVIRTEDLSLPIFLANPALLKRLENLAQDMLDQVDTQAIWTGRVGHLISKLLLSGEKPSLDAVARELAISTRHLQNKLRDEGTTYRKLLEQLRQETALRYLQDSTETLCDIAFLLGFSDQSAFTNAFKRWTGSSPHTFRRNHLSPPTDAAS
jgi:AraC-like DNA-binding protein